MFSIKSRCAQIIARLNSLTMLTRKTILLTTQNCICLNLGLPQSHAKQGMRFQISQQRGSVDAAAHPSHNYSLLLQNLL